ncbi:hypothetical protein PX699_05690 [Sphingobium sp. H39-3-25]|uniref:hypothetical protein n=1 Tax=Sphingobium arseniciresistens TaxID=3030834 RepID=UPI0023B9A548|nr:hypothetical protein [Sphingobium arseniciresistens]
MARVAAHCRAGEVSLPPARGGIDKGEVRGQSVMTMQDQPDLSTKAGRKAYRHELRMVAVRPRRVGLWLMVAGLLVMALPLVAGIHSIAGLSPQFLGAAMMAAAVPLLIAAVLLRSRYHMQRMRGNARRRP